jgi:hypothetical protein
MTWRAPNNLDEVWNPSTIENYITWTEQDIEKAKRYINKAKERLELVKSIKWAPIVRLSRQKMNKVYYYVSLHYRAADDPKKTYCPFGSDYSKKFSGNERKAAIEYAEKLAVELGAEIERNGF